MQHGVGSVYDVQLRVPLIVKYPGQHEALGSDALASHVDIMPTLLAAAGCTPPQGLQGQSLLKPRDNSATVYAEARAFGEYQSANPRLAGVRRAIYMEPWKLIASTAAPPELYNLANDPGELQNQYRPGDSVSIALTARIKAWTGALPRRPNVKPSTKMLEQIKSLGYIQGEW
jgi:arylsulfatase A-like enzyme